MRRSRQMTSVLAGLLLAGIFWIPTGLKAEAEEVSPPGYHEYSVNGEEAIDHWYGVARGTYLKDAVSGIKNTGTRKVAVSGTTYARMTCEKVKVTVYLDESTNDSDYGVIGTYRYSESNTTSCHGSQTDISVTSGRYYRARGSHSVTQGSTTESMTTMTAGVKAS